MRNRIFTLILLFLILFSITSCSQQSGFSKFEEIYTSTSGPSLPSESTSTETSQPAASDETEIELPTNTDAVLPSITPDPPTETAPPVPQFSATPNIDLFENCPRFYSNSSIWNTPIDWSKAQIHSQNDQMMAAFFQSSSVIGANTDSYAPNIYFVDNQTPLVPVKLRKNRFRDAINDQYIIYGEPAATIWVPMPSIARPAPGTDAQLVIINIDTGEEWGFIFGEITDQGQWVVGGAYRYHIDNSGVPPSGFGQRGSGIGQLAGIIRPCEVERGFIGHAVTIAYDYPCAAASCEKYGLPSFIPPFTKTDGDGTQAMDIPEGARMAIRPEITVDQIIEACNAVQGCVTWAITMQTYGGFIVDNSGHPKTFGEGSATANWNPQIWSKHMLNGIPSSWYVVLDWNTDR